MVVMNAYGKHQMQEQQTQPQQQGASNKDCINNNFENVPFTDCDNDNNNRSSHQADCNSNDSNHDSNDNTNNSNNRSSDNSTDYSNDGNIDNCNKSNNTDCNINNNIYDVSDSTNDIGVDNSRNIIDNNPIIKSNLNSRHQISSSNNNYNESCSDNMNQTIDCLVTKKFGNASLYISTSWKHIRDSCPEQGKGELIEIMELLNVDVSVSLICISISICT